MENVKEVVAEFEGRVNTEVRQQEQLNVMGHLNTNNFIFPFFYFYDLILIFFSLFFYFSFGR